MYIIYMNVYVYVYPHTHFFLIGKNKFINERLLSSTMDTKKPKELRKNMYKKATTL